MSCACRYTYRTRETSPLSPLLKKSQCVAEKSAVGGETSAAGGFPTPDAPLGEPVRWRGSPA
jgi:hypothetical protein